MNDKSYTVVVVFEAKPGKEKELQQVLSSLIEPTLREEGCINYTLYQCRDNPAKFMFYENWQSKEALMKHGQTPHINDWRSKREELLAKPNEGSFWELVI